MDKKVYDMNSPRERFFGFIPRESVTKWFMIANLVYFIFCCFIWPKIPGVLIFGWWPSHHFVTNIFIANWAAIMWGGYYYKLWPLLDDDYTEEGDEE